MSAVGERERRAHERVVAFFRDALGYRYLDDWTGRGGKNVEEGLLRAWLAREEHGPDLIDRIIHRVRQAAALASGKTLYDANRRLYGLLRYGVKFQPSAGEQHVTVPLVDWLNPENNDFAIAEEVTVEGKNRKRPDIVLYVNGLALGVIELKRSTVSVSEGIRQNLDSQKRDFVRHFFTTVQFAMAGNETEGLRYGVIETPARYWLRWKESGVAPAAGDNVLLRELGQICRKERFLELVHDFTVFDGGVRKTCRHNQYFGVRAAQERVRDRQGGIIWHTQGSGKSLIMVWLARWIHENIPDGRVLIITDRKELDEQIERVFQGVDEDIHRTTSGSDLVGLLNSTEVRLIASLVHKFGRQEHATDSDIEGYIADIRGQLPAGFEAKGSIFVFVDECHRTQSGTMHRAMTELLPEAILIGFTGTPLLRRDKKTTQETFGSYIHTYRYDEAVRDGVVLDLTYEARRIDQRLGSRDKVDEWFDARTRGLTDVAKARLRERWGTMQSLLSSEDRLKKIAADILFDMGTRDRLHSGRGNAMIVCDSIYAACRLYEMFHGTALQGKCAVVTSYEPTVGAIKGEETGEGPTERQRQYEIYRRMLADHFGESEDDVMGKAELFEREVRRRFVKEPAQMKLLIVVDRLLTGFDAPPASVLYIDKPMQDHGLFQAVCRVNRIDGDDKEFGTIVDYRDLFRALERSVADYTGGAFDGYDRSDVEGLLKDRLKHAQERLEEAREAVKALCEPVEPPQDTAAYLRYFCAEKPGDMDQLKANEPKRLKLYTWTAAFVRAYANLANEMQQAKYSDSEAHAIRVEVRHYEDVRTEVKLASGDYVDLKTYEPAMRHLLDSYVEAEESDVISTFDDLPLVQLLVERGRAAVGSFPRGIRSNRDATADAIENNVRRRIVDERAVNPRYYEKMSRLLDELIEARHRETLDYEEYLAKITELAKKVANPAEDSSYPATINTSLLRALFDALEEEPALMVREPPAPYGKVPPPDSRERRALDLDKAIRKVKKADWRGNVLKEREVRNAIHTTLVGYYGRVDDAYVKRMFELVKAQQDL
ncbi:MAG: type I restriction endonuclease subunit R [Acidobacteria bacterium]|nr:type I restriction endonuclease subunit R [Acidobacteriota bacterium]